jgi:hypothetical protein
MDLRGRAGSRLPAMLHQLQRCRRPDAMKERDIAFTPFFRDFVWIRHA